MHPVVTLKYLNCLRNTHTHTHTQDTAQNMPILVRDAVPPWRANHQPTVHNTNQQWQHQGGVEGEEEEGAFVPPIRGFARPLTPQSEEKMAKIRHSWQFFFEFCPLRNVFCPLDAHHKKVFWCHHCNPIQCQCMTMSINLIHLLINTDQHHIGGNFKAFHNLHVNVILLDARVQMQTLAPCLSHPLHLLHLYCIQLRTCFSKKQSARGPPTWCCQCIGHDVITLLAKAGVANLKRPLSFTV